MLKISDVTCTDIAHISKQLLVLLSIAFNFFKHRICLRYTKSTGIRINRMNFMCAFDFLMYTAKIHCVQHTDMLLLCANSRSTEGMTDLDFIRHIASFRYIFSSLFRSIFNLLHFFFSFDDVIHVPCM